MNYVPAVDGWLPVLAASCYRHVMQRLSKTMHMIKSKHTDWVTAWWITYTQQDKVGREHVCKTIVETQESTTAKKPHKTKMVYTKKYGCISSIINNWVFHTPSHIHLPYHWRSFKLMVPLKVEAHVLLAVLNIRFFLTAPMAPGLAWIKLTNTQSEKTWSWKCDATKLLLYILLTNKIIHEVPLYWSTWTFLTD